MVKDIFEGVPAGDKKIAMAAASAQMIRTTGSLPTIHDDEGIVTLQREAREILDNPKDMATARADLEKNVAIKNRAYPLPGAPGDDFKDVPSEDYHIAHTDARARFLRQEEPFEPSRDTIRRETRRIIDNPEAMASARKDYDQNKEVVNHHDTEQAQKRAENTAQKERFWSGDGRF